MRLIIAFVMGVTAWASSGTAAEAQLPLTVTPVNAAQVLPPALPATQPASLPAVPKLRLKIGLALSGGGARGAAHVGVIKILEELKIPIDYIAGTSMGALVGAAYASGTPIKELERRLATVDWNDLFTDISPRADRSFLRKE